jgi:hypothetical protein
LLYSKGVHWHFAETKVGIGVGRPCRDKMEGLKTALVGVVGMGKMKTG